MRALPTQVNTDVERKMVLIDALAKIWKQLESGHVIDRSNSFMKILRLAREVQ